MGGSTRRSAVAVIIAFWAGCLAACFDPVYSDDTLCGPRGECPPGKTCSPDNRCRALGADGPLVVADSPLSPLPDAHPDPLPIDGPPDARPVACQGDGDCANPPDLCSTAGACDLQTH